MTSGKIGFWAHIALMFLVRSGRSTAALSMMVVTAVSALIFLSALAVGVNDAMLRNTVELFSGHITGHRIPASVRPADLCIRGVKGVLKRVYLPGVLSNGPLGRPVTLCGIDPVRETAMTALNKKIVEGGYPQNNRPEILIGKLLAAELGVRKGSILRFTPGSRDNAVELTVSGIYHARIDPLDRGIAFIPLSGVPATLPWTAGVFLEKEVPPRQVIDAYAGKWPDTCRFESWETTMPDLRQLIDLEYVSMALVIVLVFGVVAIGIACSFVIFIIKNMREYGIMKSMGVTTGEMSLLIGIKIALMNAIACGAGLVLGSMAAWVVAAAGGVDITAFTSHNQYFTVSGIIYPRLTAFSLLAPPVVSFLFSLAAAIWPMAVLAKRKTADIMRMV